MKMPDFNQAEDVLSTIKELLLSEQQNDGVEMSLHKLAQEEEKNWLDILTSTEPVHDFEMSFENNNGIMNNKDKLHQDSTTAMDTAPVPLLQQDSLTANCAVMNEVTLPSAPRLQQDFSESKCGLHQDSTTAMDTTLVPLLQQDLTTTKVAIINDATLRAPHLQQDFSKATYGLHQDSTTAMDTTLVPLPQHDSATAKCAIMSDTMPPGTPCLQQDFSKANPTPTPIVPLVNQENPAGTTNIKVEMEAVPDPNPSLQLVPTTPNVVLNAAPISIKWPGQDKIFSMNKGKRGRRGRREMVVAQELIKSSNAGPNDGNADESDEPWWKKNWIRETRPRPFSRVTDSYYYHKTIDITCRSLVEVERFEFEGISPYVARKQRKLEAEAASSSLPPANLDSKETNTKKRKRDDKEGEAAEGSLEVVHGKRKGKEVEGCPEEGGKTASRQTPISESVKLDGSVQIIETECFSYSSGSSNQGSISVAVQLTENQAAEGSLKEVGDVKKKRKEVRGSSGRGGKTVSQAPISETVKLDVPVFHCASGNQGSSISAPAQLTESHAAEGSLKEVGDLKKQSKEVEGSTEEGRKTPSLQAPISETVKLDVSVFHYASINKGSSTSVAGQDKMAKNVKKQNYEPSATQTALENAEARFDATMSALASMEARLEETIEFQIENWKLLRQALMASKGNSRSNKK